MRLKNGLSLKPYYRVMSLRRLLALLIASVASSGYAQNLPSVRGSVVDPTGATVPGATVRLEASDGKLVAQTTVDSAGNFTLANLPAGAFSLAVPAFSGFASHTQTLRLTTGVTTVKITLDPESINQQITVGAEQSLSTDPSANRDTVSVTGNELRKLPVFDQDYIATLTPFLDGAAGSSGGVTLIVDGVEMKSVGVSASAIQEVRINNDPYSAEFNRPGRGRIEIITMAKPTSSFATQPSTRKITLRVSARPSLAASTRAISPAPSATAGTPASSCRPLTASRTQPLSSTQLAPTASSTKTC
jgi:hypothetical protein